MAFDLVQYFTAQIKLQKPQLFSTHTDTEKQAHIEEVNALALGQLISLWKQDRHKLYQEVLTSDPLYIQGIARHLTTSAHNQSNLRPSDLESSISEVLSLQLTELKQLDETGSFGENGLTELLLGQIEHLSGQAADWVWSTNQLTELLGSKPAPVQDISLEATMQEFNQMVHQAQPNEHDAIATVKNGHLLLLPRGASQTVSGLNLPRVTLTRKMGDQHSYTTGTGTDNVTAVKAFYYETKAGKKNHVIVGDNQENPKELRFVHRDKATAELAANAEYNRCKRGAKQLSYTLALGDPTLIPEQEYEFTGLKPEIDDLVWLATNLTHNLSDQGLITSIELELQLPDADDVSQLFEDNDKTADDTKADGSAKKTGRNYADYTGVIVYYKDKTSSVKLTSGDQSAPLKMTHLYKSKASATAALKREQARIDKEKKNRTVK